MSVPIKKYHMSYNTDNEGSEFTLWYSWVLLARFIHLDSVILQVEENDAVADAVLFFSLLVNCLLEVGIEPQHLVEDKN